MYKVQSAKYKVQSAKYKVHSVPLQCKGGLQFQLSQKLVIIAQNGGQGPDKHETRKKEYIWGVRGSPGDYFGVISWPGD